MNLKKYFIYLIFILATIYFIYQHYLYLSWDFIVYILNAKYLSSDGIYFEITRPPLVPFLLSIFGIVKSRLAEYLFIILVSSLHFYSSLKLAEKFNINKKIYYTLSLSPFLLLNGLTEGTELLTLSLMQMFLAYYDKIGSSAFLALAFLTRYPAIIFSPLVLFKRDIKKIIIDIGIFLLILSPWLIYNFINYNNFIYSILDSYALNIKARSYLPYELGLFNILIIGNYLLVFFILYFTKNLKHYKNHLIVLTFLLISLISYFNTPVKELRYLFLILIPLVYFSSLYISKLKYKSLIIFFILLISLTAIILPVSNKNNINEMQLYNSAIPDLDHCTLMSNAWVYLNYLNTTTEPSPRKELVNYYISKGNRILLFYNNGEPDYIKDENFLNNLSIIKKTDRFILLGDKNKCNIKKNVYIYNYLSNLNQTTNILYNYSIGTSTKEIISNKY